MKDIAGLYERLLPRLTKLAVGMTRKSHEWLRSEFVEMIGLEFMKAVNTHKEGAMPLEDWAVLQLQNALRDARKYHDRRINPHQLFVGTYQKQEHLARCDHSPDIWLDLSEDAVTVANWLIAYQGRAGKGVDSVKNDCYRLMSWRRFWCAVAEIRDYLTEPEPC